MYTRSRKLAGVTDVGNEEDDTVRSARSSAKIAFPPPHLISHFNKRSPMYRGIALWDTLPAGVQRGTSKVKFKLEINKIKDLRAKLKHGYN